MARTQWIGVGLLLAAGVVSGLTGCGSTADGTDHPSVETLPQGLTVLSATDAAVKAVFRKDMHAVYFETVRGVPLVESYVREHPEWGTHEMDARILDEQGNTLVLQRGGDKFLDPTWEADVERMVKRQRATHTKTPIESIQLANEALAALSASKELVARPDHLQTSVRLGKDVFAERGNGHPVRIPTPEVAAKLPYSCETLDSSCDWYWSGYGTYTVKYTCIDWFCTGHHSAVVANALGYTIYTCNHGGCANTLNKTTPCSGGGYGGFLASERSTDTGSITGACFTSYSWWSGGGSHNCHDDSRMEGRGILYGPQDHYAGTCQGEGDWQAPGMSGNACP